MVVEIFYETPDLITYISETERVLNFFRRSITKTTFQSVVNIVQETTYLTEKDTDNPKRKKWKLKCKKSQNDTPRIPTHTQNMNRTNHK